MRYCNMLLLTLSSFYWNYMSNMRKLRCMKKIVIIVIIIENYFVSDKCFVWRY